MSSQRGKTHSQIGGGASASPFFFFLSTSLPCKSRSVLERCFFCRSRKSRVCQLTNQQQERSRTETHVVSLNLALQLSIPLLPSSSLVRLLLGHLRVVYRVLLALLLAQDLIREALLTLRAKQEK